MLKALALSEENIPQYVLHTKGEAETDIELDDEG